MYQPTTRPTTTHCVGEWIFPNEQHGQTTWCYWCFPTSNTWKTGSGVYILITRNISLCETLFISDPISWTSMLYFLEYISQKVDVIIAVTILQTFYLVKVFCTFYLWSNLLFRQLILWFVHEVSLVGWEKACILWDIITLTNYKLPQEGIAKSWFVLVNIQNSHKGVMLSWHDQSWYVKISYHRKKESWLHAASLSGTII